MSDLITRAWWKRRPAKSLGATAAVVLLASLLPILPASPQDSTPVDAQFHSFVPAPAQRPGFKSSTS